MNLLFHSICVTVAIMCATATAASTPRLWRDGGRRHLRPQQQRRRMTRVGTYKNSKKQNVVPPQCTPEQFVGDYKYRNCQGVETKVRVVCDTEKETKYPCDYQEAPLKNDTVDAGCVVQGAFGATHIRKDPANPSVCQLDFVALKDSCKADALPSGFGVKAEVDIMTAGPADTSSTSTLLLRFSKDKGVVYYNEDEPQKALFLHEDLSTGGRKLEDCPTTNCFRMPNWRRLKECPSSCSEYPQCSTDIFSRKGWCQFKNETAIAAAETASNEAKRLEDELLVLQDDVDATKSVLEYKLSVLSVLSVLQDDLGADKPVLEYEISVLEENIPVLQKQVDGKQQDAEKKRKLFDELNDNLRWCKDGNILNDWAIVPVTKPCDIFVCEYPQCSTALFDPSINFCNNWCDVAGRWPECGIRFLMADDERNTANVDYRCDCTGCNNC